MNRKKKTIILKTETQLEKIRKTRKVLPSHLTCSKVIPDKKKYKRKPKFAEGEPN